MQEIWIALIGGLCAAIPTVLTAIITNKRDNNIILYRIDELDKKVHEHNNLIDRMYKVESRVTLVEDNLKELKHN